MLVAERGDARLGVIADARRRRRRRHAALLCLAIAAVGSWLAFAGGPGRPQAPRLRSSSSLRYLSGDAADRTGLRLIALENLSRPYLVDVDRGTAVPVGGIALPPSRILDGTTVYPLVAHGAGALAFANVRACTRCGTTVTEYRIDARGRASRVWTRWLGYHQTFIPAVGSTSVWVSTWPHDAPCSLALEPSRRPAVRVPCGSLGSVTSAGAWISNGGVLMLVDPASGRVLERLHPAQDLQLLRGTVALATSPSPGAQSLAIVDLRTGARRTLRWPSALTFGVQAIAQPNGPLVALRFGQPWYPPSQAVDVWVLDTRTGALTHVPGFPALELLKFSSVTWTADGRLLIASKGGGRTVLGVWRPGEHATEIRSVPPIEGYTSVVPLPS